MFQHREHYVDAATLPLMHPHDSTRDELIRAGLELNDELPLARLFAGSPSARVAERAGVTTGSFFHHFRDAAAFSEAVVRSYLHDRPLVRDIRTLVGDAVTIDDWERSLPTAFLGVWQLVIGDPTMRAERRGQMHLYAHHRTPLPARVDGDSDSDGADPGTVGEVLGSIYRAQATEIETTWKSLVEAAELRLYGPIEARRLSVVFLSLLLGLEIIHDVDPSLVDDHLYADASIALIGAVTRPDTSSRHVQTSVVLGQEIEGSPQARSGARRRETNRNHVIAATTGMFDLGWDHIRLRDVADASGLSAQTVINLFGAVRKVCASTFRRHLDSYSAAIDAAMPERPVDAVRGALTVLARAAATEPNPARAFLVERLGVRLTDEFELSDDDIRVIVPYGLRIAPAVAAIAGREPADPDVADLTAAMIDTLLAHAIPRPGRTEESVDLTMRLMPST